MSIYDTLNDQQKEAVFKTEGPVLILAGAGSGKTRVITHRIAYLLEECDVNPWNILAITFTNKAAGEMRERVDQLVGFGSESIWISTFHSMCVRILRRYIDQLGYGYQNSFTIYDTDDQKSLMKQVCQKIGINTKELKERAILGAISHAKDELMTPLQYKDTHKVFYEERMIGDAYEEYQRQLRANNALDFDDLLMLTVELFKTREEILRSYQDRFQYIMVDEYQDTNLAQFELVRMLAGENRNLCVVGDDDQSIYKFRGANIRNILDFEKVFPDAMVVKLEQNYRSTQNVLDAANAVIRHNVGRKNKALWTDHGKGSSIHYREFNTDYDEADFIAEDIDRHLRQDHKLSYKDFAVLYRTNAQSRVLEEKFIMHSVPYNIVGGQNFYSRMEVHDILSYLRTIDNASDDINTLRILNVPRRGIGKTTIDRLTVYAMDKEMTLFSAMEIAQEIPGIGKGAARISEFVQLIRDLRDYAQEHSVEELIGKIIEEIEYEQWLNDYDDETAEDRMSNVNELISKAVQYERDAEEDAGSEDSQGPSLSGFLTEVALVADIDNVEGSDEKVLLMTMHSAKGLEFPHVYLAGMEENIFPSYMSVNSDDPDALEEERRLAYVGITRAKEDLTITRAMSRMQRGEWQYNPVSRFVLEIPEELLDTSPRRKTRKDYDFDDLGEDDDFSFSFNKDDFGSGMSRSRSSFGSGNGSGSSGFSGSGRSFGSSNEGKGFGKSFSSGSVSTQDKAPARRDTRLKAIYVKPQTAPEKKPYIAKAGGLGSLQKGMPAGTKPDYDTGDRVSHVKYGSGTVTALEKGPKDYKVTVQFDEAGQKIMYAGFAKLEKL